MSHNYKLLIYIFLILISTLFRILWIGNIPYGLNWDETAYGYNAYSIMLTGKDEWGVKYPMYLKSFGEYKPAALSYMYIPVFRLFGESNLSIRVVPAILGIVSILFLYGFMLKITNNNTLSFLTALIVAISPWHIHFSRAALDPIISFAFMVAGLYFFISERKFFQILAGLSFGLSMYTYNSSRFFVPVMLIIYFLVFFRKNLKTEIIKKWLAISSIILIGGVILWQTVFGVAGIHAKFLLITNEPYIAVKTNNLYDGCQKAHLPLCRIITNRRLILTGEILKHYLMHFQTDFLFFDRNTPTTSFPDYGNLLIICLPFLIIGLFNMQRYNKQINIFFVSWLLLAPIPASLTNDIPHSGRTLIALPAFAYFIALGLVFTLAFAKKHKCYKVAIIIIITSFLINISFYVKDYALLYKQDSEYFWQGYFQDVIPFVWKQRENYRSIYFNDEYANPFIFFAWYNKIDPSLVQKEKNRLSIANIQFISQEKILEKTVTEKNSLFVSTSKLDKLSLLEQFYSLSIYQTAKTWFYIYSNN